MANENFNGWKPYSFTSGAAFAKGEQLKLDGANSKQVVKTAAITDLVVGVALQEATAANEQIPVMTVGPIVKAMAGAATTINAELMSGGTVDGRLEDASGATARSCAIGLEAAGASGDLIEVILVHSAKGPANS